MNAAELIYEKMKALLPGMDLELTDVQCMVENSNVGDIDNQEGYEVIIKALIDVIQDLIK